MKWEEAGTTLGSLESQLLEHPIRRLRTRSDTKDVGDFLWASDKGIRWYWGGMSLAPCSERCQVFLVLIHQTLNSRPYSTIPQWYDGAFRELEAFIFLIGSLLVSQFHHPQGR